MKGYNISNDDIDHLENPSTTDTLQCASKDQPRHALRRAAQRRPDLRRATSTLRPAGAYTEATHQEHDDDGVQDGLAANEI